MSVARPRVSIGMPVYNGEAFLAAAIDSVLAQSFTNFEVIISDNASSDRTEEISRAYAGRDDRIRYFRNDKNAGAARNFNRVFELSRGTYFKWLAHDDLLAPTYLERCASVLDGHAPSVVLCFPRRRFITPDGNPVPTDPFTVESRRALARGLHRVSFARLVRVCDSRFPMLVFGLMHADAIRKTRLIGAFSGADLIFVAEMRLLGELWEVPEELYFQRLHPPTPDVLERMTRTGDATWYDPTRRRCRLFPEGRLFLEYLRAIRGSALSPWGKARGYMALPGEIAFRFRRATVLTSRRMRRCFWRAWSCVSLAAVKASRFTSFPLRFWAFCSGLRRRGRGEIGVAFSRPWYGSPADLLRFAAERLCARRDPPGDRLLADWLTGSSPVRRGVAARVIGFHPDRFGPLVRDSIQRQPAAPIETVKRVLEDQAGPEFRRAWERFLPNGAGPRIQPVHRGGAQQEGRRVV